MKGILSPVAFCPIPTYFDRMSFTRLFSRRRSAMVFLFLLGALIPIMRASAAAPRDNPYDVLGRVFAPFWRVFLTGGHETSSANRAMMMTLRMTAVTGRLSKEFEGATLHAWVQFPDKLKLEAPALGEMVTVCRDGNVVWATPGQKIEFLLSKFGKIGLPEDLPIPGTPLPLPITEKQAVFLPALPALFTIKNPDFAEIIPLNGEDNRLITGGIMPELAKAIDAEDFLARLWVASSYMPRRVEITRRDFTCTVDITELKFTSGLPAETWMVPPGVTDVYRTNAHKLQAILFVVMNSLQAKRGLQPSDAATTPAPLQPSATPVSFRSQ